MKTFPSVFILCGALSLGLAPALRAADAKLVMPTGDAKKLAARYALTRSRIDDLLSARLRPVPLPATTLTNPFYRPEPIATTTPTPDKVETPIPPDAADQSDADILAKYAGTLKVGGYLTLGGAPHVAINSIICKVGDVVTVGNKDRPLFLRIESITPQEFTLRLNEAGYTVQIRK